MEQVAAFLALDWSDATHDLWLFDPSTNKTAEAIRTHTPEDLEAWATAWRARVAGPPMAGGREPSRGPLIDALLTSDVWVLDPITPTTVAKYRAAFAPRRAQEDPREAADRLAWRMQHRDRLRAWRPTDAQTRTRHSRVAHRRRLVHDRTRIRHRLTALRNADGPHG